MASTTHSLGTVGSICTGINVGLFTVRSQWSFAVLFVICRSLQATTRESCSASVRFSTAWMPMVERGGGQRDTSEFWDCHPKLGKGGQWQTTATLELSQDVGSNIHNGTNQRLAESESTYLGHSATADSQPLRFGRRLRVPATEGGRPYTPIRLVLCGVGHSPNNYHCLMVDNVSLAAYVGTDVYTCEQFCK